MSTGKKEGWYFAKWGLQVLFFFSLTYSCGEKKSAPVKPIVADIEKGRQLFLKRCASCHKVNQEMTGPALKGAEARWPDQKKLYAFIRNSSEVIRNDKYAHELWLQYNQTLMTTQPDLSDTDIRAVLDYINTVSEQ